MAVRLLDRPAASQPYCIPQEDVRGVCSSLVDEGSGGGEAEDRIQCEGTLFAAEAKKPVEDTADTAVVTL